MDLFGWIQLALFMGLLLLVTKPVGLYLVRVLEPGRKDLSGPRPSSPSNGCFIGSWDRPEKGTGLEAVRPVPARFQPGRVAVHLCHPPAPASPAVESRRDSGPVSPDLAFNTAASFTTNTNWQNYGGESTLSYFSQMVGLAFHNFVSAAAGIAIAAALVRGIARHSAKTIGNFWVDLVRINLYLLLPICHRLFASSWSRRG